MPSLARGASIGRYIVLGLIGRGAMGEVYAAYDPELDRKVAVKLLRAGTRNPAEAKSRLLREAQAMARLSHPNVIAVHDVGSIGDRVFVAMEFVNGHTVSYWLHADARPWQEIVRVFLAAGRGLAAAHAANMIHRDFKADNVMLGFDGQVRVTDFGLARQLAGGRPKTSPTPIAVPVGPPDPDIESTRRLPVRVESEGGALLGFAAYDAEDEPATGADSVSEPGVALDEAAAREQAARLRDDPLAQHLTQTGFVMGTPAYMSPEVFSGRPADACSDQFSFCVALYEALYRMHPFGGKTLSVLSENVLAGRLRPAPDSSRVPGWVRRALVRGMQIKPDLRWPSMEALLAALASSPRRRGWVYLAAGAGAAAFAFAIWTARQPMRRPACVVSPDRFAGVWEPGAGGARREAIGKAMRASGKPYAAASYGGLARLLDRYVEGWSAMYKDVCEATNVRGEQSDEVLDVRMSCLRDRWRELRALSDVLVENQTSVVTNAVAAASALTPIERCAEVGTVRAGVAAPPEGVRKQVENLRNRLVNVKALEHSSNFGRALEDMTTIVTEARALGYRPVLAEALNRLGRLQTGMGQAERADANLEEAIWIAEAASHDEVVAEATTEQIFVSGYLLHDPLRARRWTSHAQAVLDRLGGHEELRGWMLNNTGVVLDADGQHQEAASRFYQALQIKERVLGKDHPDVGYTLANLADTLNALGRPMEALELSNRGVDIILRTFGPGHPDMFSQLVNRAEILIQLARYEDARRDAENAVAIDERELGHEVRNMVFALAPLGEAELGLGRPEHAVPPLERALELAEGAGLEAELPRLEFALARALWDAGQDRDRARDLVERAVTRKLPTGVASPSDARDDQLLRRAKAWLASRPQAKPKRR